MCEESVSTTSWSWGNNISIGKLLSLDAGQLRNALGLAGSQASGTFASFGTAAVKFHQSHGALAGLSAGLLAAEHFKTTGEILTHRDGGLFNVMSDGGDPNAVVAGLGERWELEDISLRLWPTAAALQSVVSALMALIERCDLQARDVSKVHIGLPKASYEMNGALGWQSRLNAMLSARYVTSVVLHDRACWLNQFDAAHLANRRITEFAESHVETRMDPAIDPDGAIVTVVTVNGEQFMEPRAYPKGDPRDPLTSDQVMAKLRVSAEPCVGIDRVGVAATLLGDLDKLENILPLFAVLGNSS